MHSNNLNIDCCGRAMVLKKIFCLMLGILPMQTALAGMTEIRDSNNLLAIQAMVLTMDYAETDSAGVLLDTEKGPISGRQITLSRMWGSANWYAQVQYSRNEGRTNYVGGLIGPPPTPYGSVVTTSGADVINYALRLGKGLDAGKYVNYLFTPYVEWGRQEWMRGVNAGETYYHNSIGIGMLWQYSEANSKLVYSAYALGGRTYGASIDVVGYFNGALGSSPLTKAGLGLDYSLTRTMYLNAGVDYVNFAYGKSAVYGLYLEPDSKSTYLMYKAGVGFSF